jgi:hypothetical protein
MSHHTFGGRHAPRALTGLDFGLRVRVQASPLQRTIFSGAENLSVRALTSELAELVCSLRVYSYAVRGHLEHVTSVLILDIECGEWSLPAEPPSTWPVFSPRHRSGGL